MNIFEWILNFPARIKLAKCLINYEEGSDDWVYRQTKYLPYHFGYYSSKNIATYFSGDSTVNISRPNDIEDTLDTFEYKKQDSQQYWQHPINLESTKTGNCMDFSLWSWRKFIELNHNATLVVGGRSGNEGNGHAWVILETDGMEILFDPVMKKGRAYELKDIKSKYVPFFGIDSNMTGRIYNGYLMSKLHQYA